IDLGKSYKLGSLDILMLSLCQTFLMFKGLGLRGILVFSVVAMEAPYLFVLVLQTAGGIPLIPFTSAIAATALFYDRLLPNYNTKRAYV
ncbi:MAG: hypothetical protein QXR69_01985, partial [Conexivisphaerales archaeon]